MLNHLYSVVLENYSKNVSFHIYAQLQTYFFRIDAHPFIVHFLINAPSELNMFINARVLNRQSSVFE